MKELGQRGLTIIELMMSIAIASIITTVLFAISLGFFGDTVRSQVTAEMAVDSHFMLRAVIEDLRLADSIGTANNISDANAPPGGWITSDTNNVLIINRPATNSSNDIIYNTNTGNPYNNEYVYFVSNGTLYKRLLKNSAATGNSTVTTCPQALATTSCPADRKYSSYINDLTFTFYDESNAVTTNTARARSVKVGLSTARKVFGKRLNFNNSVLTKLRN